MKSPGPDKGNTVISLQINIHSNAVPTFQLQFTQNDLFFCLQFANTIQIGIVEK